MKPAIGLDFAHALRAIVRQDPDIIMIGEMRDLETSRIAIQSALTGHLVLSTLHTNSAAETIVRLNDLGVDSFSFADSLQGILAQRLQPGQTPTFNYARAPQPWLDKALHLQAVCDRHHRFAERGLRGEMVVNARLPDAECVGDVLITEGAIALGLNQPLGEIENLLGRRRGRECDAQILRMHGREIVAFRRHDLRRLHAIDAGGLQGLRNRDDGQAPRMACNLALFPHGLNVAGCGGKGKP